MAAEKFFKRCHSHRLTLITVIRLTTAHSRSKSHYYQVRSDRAIRRHWQLVCCAFSFCWYHHSHSITDHAWLPGLSGCQMTGQQEQVPELERGTGEKKLNGKESLRHARQEQMFSVLSRSPQAKFSVQPKKSARRGSGDRYSLGLEHYER